MAALLDEKDAIQELTARYCFLVDGARFEEWSELFVEDGSFELTGMTTLTGRENLLRFMKNVPLNDKGRPGFKHCVLNQMIEVAGERASSQCYFLLIREGKPIHVDIAGRYEDTLVKRGGRWLFETRRVYFDFGGPGG